MHNPVPPPGTGLCTLSGLLPTQICHRRCHTITTTRIMCLVKWHIIIRARGKKFCKVQLSCNRAFKVLMLCTLCALKAGIQRLPQKWRGGVVPTRKGHSPRLATLGLWASQVGTTRGKFGPLGGHTLSFMERVFRDWTTLMWIGPVEHPGANYAPLYRWEPPGESSERGTNPEAAGG